MSGFVEATVNVFPYQIVPGTVILLGLYLDGQLIGTREYNLTGTYMDQDLSGINKVPATMKGGVVNGAANFSNSLLGFTVSKTPLGPSVASGTTMTVTYWASSPVWVQVDRTAVIDSFETHGIVSYSPPASIISNSGTVAPYTLSVWFVAQ